MCVETPKPELERHLERGTQEGAKVSPRKNIREHFNPATAIHWIPKRFGFPKTTKKGSEFDIDTTMDMNTEKLQDIPPGTERHSICVASRITCRSIAEETTPTQNILMNMRDCRRS